MKKGDLHITNWRELSWWANFLGKFVKLTFVCWLHQLSCWSCPSIGYFTTTKRLFFIDVTNYHWDEPYLFRKYNDKMILRCVTEEEKPDILYRCHSSNYGRYFGSHRMTMKVLQSRFYCATLFKNAYSFVMKCDKCQRTRNIFKRQEMPLRGILEVSSLMYGE